MGNLIKSPLVGAVSRLNPFVDVDDWFNSVAMRPLSLEMDTSPQIKMDLTENEKSYVVHADIPGVQKNAIKVSVDGNTVSIMAETKLEKEETKEGKMLWHERYQGATYRSFTLAYDIDDENTKAKYENGVLELTLPKKTGSAHHKEIAIS
jgi:HSP20 family protein